LDEPGATKPACEHAAHGLALHLDGWVREVNARARPGAQLRVTLQAYSAQDIDRFEPSTIDLTSHRSRARFCSLCVALFNIANARGTADLRDELAHVERAAASRDDEPANTMSHPHLQRADPRARA
jgi:hypothetical protein